MFAVESYAAVRRFVFVEGHSRREAARVFELSRETVAKMCRFSLPPGYTRTKPAAKPKLGPLLPVIDAIPAADRTGPVKQRHTAKRIFERLRDEHGFAGGYTLVKDHVRICRARGRETFVPLAHPPGHAQVDFGEAIAIVAGVRQKIHFFCMDLPQSDACFVKAYPRETTEAFLDGHVAAFAFFGGVPLSTLYDNTKIAVAKICGDGKRERTRAFIELCRQTFTSGLGAGGRAGGDVAQHADRLVEGGAVLAIEHGVDERGGDLGIDRGRRFGRLLAARGHRLLDRLDLRQRYADQAPERLFDQRGPALRALGGRHREDQRAALQLEVAEHRRAVLHRHAPGEMAGAPARPGLGLVPSQFQNRSFSRCSGTAVSGRSATAAWVPPRANGTRTRWNTTSSPSLLCRVGVTVPIAFGTTSNSQAVLTSEASPRSVSSASASLARGRACLPRGRDRP